ncbi:hypothetical protein NDU88_007026 [Pleurodeles waltl]|uniref:Reverse transcriptase zinc-binding domain-containing protein n=1 Tax=Pleurodeles waltl TaxID=8319 RepID=A0AAV7VRB8_PLEWA|nr:hypothetical protein NDU88_007026 [Pleurodeles waltl]
MTRTRPRDVNTVACTSGAWAALLRRSDGCEPFAPTMPLLEVADERMSSDVRLRDLLSSSGLSLLGDCFVNERLRAPEEALSDEVDNALHRLYLLRVYAMLQARFAGLPIMPQSCRALELLWRVQSPRQLITKLYRCVQEQRRVVVEAARGKWERDARMEITDAMWRSCCAHMRALSPNYRLRLIHFKFLHRLYHTPLSLRATGLREDARCGRCHAPDADFLHLAWTCEAVRFFWGEVMRVITGMTGLDLPFSPVVVLLDGVPSEWRRLVGMLLLLAKRRVVVCWGRGRAPRKDDWLQDAVFLSGAAVPSSGSWPRRVLVLETSGHLFAHLWNALVEIERILAMGVRLRAQLFGPNVAPACVGNDACWTFLLCGSVRPPPSF